MSLQLKPLYEAAVRRFSTSTAVDRFNDDFPFAVNLALDELNLMMDTAIAHVEDVESEISELDESYHGIMFAGITAHLADLGHNLRGGEVQYVDIKGSWERAKGDFLIKQLAADAATQDTKGVPTADIIGLGYKGTE
jgi:hypothetical protein